MVIQGMSGMMSAQGGDSEPVANTIAIIDVTTAAMLALSAALALLHRERGRDGGKGQGQRAWASLVGTATYLQTGEIVRYADRPPAARQPIPWPPTDSGSSGAMKPISPISFMIRRSRTRVRSRSRKPGAIRSVAKRRT